MFKTPLTKNLYKQFINSHQTASSIHSETPFVFVDQDGIRLVSSVMSENVLGSDEVVAMTIFQDGFLEVLALD